MPTPARPSAPIRKRARVCQVRAESPRLASDFASVQRMRARLCRNPASTVRLQRSVWRDCAGAGLQRGESSELSDVLRCQFRE